MTTNQSTKELVGHDTCTTTDEEDAIEALLAHGDLPDNDTNQDELLENGHLMPIGIPNPGIDVNPLEIKLGTDDVTQAIEDLPDENRFRPPTPPHHAGDTDHTAARSNINTEEGGPEMNVVPNDSVQQTEKPSTPSNKTDDTLSTPASPNKDTLKVTKYGLWKSHHKKRSYKCQKCGKCENSVHDLNEHHRCSHPPLLCSDCNKIFHVPSTFQLHLYEHQKRKIPCETCGQLFSFQGQLEQHKIVHRTIKSHKCMAKNCNRWFMHKADLKVHVATHDKTVYTCKHCESFTTHLKKYWKEHIKGHEAILPYACPICQKQFLYRQQVSRHKAKEHKKQ